MIDDYDVVIIGAGIQGVGVAQAAAAAGYRVLVLERTAIAAGTSSQSSKLIHGGLRYLESAQFRLVREALHERALLLKLAPDLVRLVPFYLPIYRHTRRKSWQIRIGLNLYRLLGGFGPGTGFESLSRGDWEQLDGLMTEGLVAVYRYYDGQTDDALLSQAVMQSAESLGAELKMPAEFLAAEIAEDGCEVSYRDGASDDGPQRNCRCKVLVNCAGPWAGRLRERIHPSPPVVKTELVQGSHLWLTVPEPSGCYYVEAPSDGRAVFVMPWKGEMLLGTTETVHNGPPDAAVTLPEETSYLLATLAHYFPQYREIGEDRIRRRYCGLRVLPKEDGSPFGRSRDVLIQGDRQRKPRVVSVVGGKLTTYRITALQVMEMLKQTLPSTNARHQDTARIPLSLR